MAMLSYCARCGRTKFFNVTEEVVEDKGKFFRKIVCRLCSYVKYLVEKEKTA